MINWLMAIINKCGWWRNFRTIGDVTSSVIEEEGWPSRVRQSPRNHPPFHPGQTSLWSYPLRHQHISTLRLLIENFREFCRDSHLYVAFDIDDRSTLWNILHIFALSPKLVTLFTMLYDGADQRKMYRQVLDRCWCLPALCSLSRFIQVRHQLDQGFLLISPTPSPPSLTTTVVTAEVVKALRKINFSYTKWRNN